MQGDNITSEIVSSRVNIFLQVNYKKSYKKFNKTLIFKRKQRNPHPKKDILLNISPPPFMSNGLFENIIRAMFDQSDQIFEAMYTWSDQIPEKIYEELKKLRETQLIEHVRNLVTNLQAIFAQSDRIFEAMYDRYDKIFGKKHK